MGFHYIFELFQVFCFHCTTLHSVHLLDTKLMLHKLYHYICSTTELHPSSFSWVFPLQLHKRYRCAAQLHPSSFSCYSFTTRSLLLLLIYAHCNWGTWFNNSNFVQMWGRSNGNALYAHVFFTIEPSVLVPWPGFARIEFLKSYHCATSVFLFMCIPSTIT